MEAAVKSGNCHVVKFCLDHVATEELPVYTWQRAMEAALWNRESAASIMEVLYQAGFPIECMRWERHPAVLAIEGGMVEAATVAVMYGGMPRFIWIDMRDAALRGEPALRYVHDLYGTLDEGTAEAGGAAGRPRYAIESGDLCDRDVLVVAIQADSLECLCLAHERGCPCHMRGVPRFFPAAKSQHVLHYVCEHMGPTCSVGVLRATATKLACSIDFAERLHTRGRAHVGGRDWHPGRLDWQLALDTVRRFVRSEGPAMGWEYLPVMLEKAVGVRRERAAALSRACFKAGQLGWAPAAHSWAPPWRPLGALPCVLLEKIAFMAHLVLPPDSDTVC